MSFRSFYSADGDMLIVPELGALHITTEFGKLHVAPGEVFVLPRGLKMTIDLQDSAEGARGWMCVLLSLSLSLLMLVDGEGADLSCCWCVCVCVCV